MNQPDQATLARLYERYSYDRCGLESVQGNVFASLTKIVRGFRRHWRGGRLLDVGFGQGAMLVTARAAGWETHGIESSPLAVEQARERGFAHAIEGDFLEEPYPPEHFDVITLIEVLEHLVDPEPFLHRAFSLLAPGGLLYATTPSGVGASARALGVAWSVICPPEHIQLFSVSSLRAVVRRAGFSRVTIRTEGVNPYELLHHLRVRVARGIPATPETFDRSTAYTLNERLSRSRRGTAVKSTANAVLRLTRLGDSLKLYAIKA